VPLSPDLGGSEHTTGTALVTEGSLTSTVSTTTRDTRDTSDGTTGTPGLSGSLFTSLLAHGVRLSLVLRHTGVNLLDDIRTDGRSEDSRQGQSSPAGLAISRGDSDGRAGRHCCRR
jgi:hypothetical protein